MVNETRNDYLLQDGERAHQTRDVLLLAEIATESGAEETTVEETANSYPPTAPPTKNRLDTKPIVSGVDTSVWMVLHTGMHPSSRPWRKRMASAGLTWSQNPKAMQHTTSTTR